MSDTKATSMNVAGIRLGIWLRVVLRADKPSWRITPMHLKPINGVGPRYSLAAARFDLQGQL